MNQSKRFIAKESELDIATTKMVEAVTVVKNLAKSVKSGTVSKKELEGAIKELNEIKRKVEILTAESKMLSGFSAVKEHLPNEKKLNGAWVLAVAAALYILFVG